MTELVQESLAKTPLIFRHRNVPADSKLTNILYVYAQ